MDSINIQWFFDYLDSLPEDSPSRIALINMFVAWKKHLEEKEKNGVKAMTKEPKKCPFCGSIPHCFTSYNGGKYIVACTNPNCIMQTVSTWEYTTEEDAIYAWNCRKD